MPSHSKKRKRDRKKCRELRIVFKKDSGGCRLNNVFSCLLDGSWLVSPLGEEVRRLERITQCLYLNLSPLPFPLEDLCTLSAEARTFGPMGYIHWAWIMTFGDKKMGARTYTLSCDIQQGQMTIRKDVWMENCKWYMSEFQQSFSHLDEKQKKEVSQIYYLFLISEFRFPPKKEVSETLICWDLTFTLASDPKRYGRKSYYSASNESEFKHISLFPILQ
jgi:hypothetical protein